MCARLAGEPTVSRVELFTQNAYFAFQVIQVFLVTTVASSATAVVRQLIDSPTSAPAILASNLPKSSNFYISYFIVQGLTIATSVLTQVVGFVIFTLLYKLLANTPRALYTKWSRLSAISWGSTLPVYTNIAVVGTLSRPCFHRRFPLTWYSHHVLVHCPPDARLGHNRHVPLLLRLAV